LNSKIHLPVTSGAGFPWPTRFPGHQCIEKQGVSVTS